MKYIKVNIHLYQSPFQYESRILRISSTLAGEKYFDRIIIVAAHLPGLPEVESIDAKRTVHRIKTFIKPTWSALFRYPFLVEWGIRAVLRFRKLNVIVVNPHSVPALPVAWFFKRYKKAKIVYDTHELETEQYGKRSLKMRISKFLERVFIKHIDYLLTTSDGYKNWYQEKYGIRRAAVVKNYSRKRNNLEKNNENILREHCRIKDSDILFVYQGIITTGRAIETLLKVFSDISPNKHIIFMGFGPLEDMVKDHCRAYPNIHYHPAVRPGDVYRYVRSCDVGFCIIERLSLSLYYTLPNKMLECLNVGVPVIVSNFPDMKGSIDEYGCGWATDVEFHSIQSIILSITAEQIKEKRKKALVWAEKNTWESQEIILRKVYENLLGVGR